MNIVIWPQGIRVFHQYLWGIFSISMWFHLQGWLTGSGPSGLNWGWLVDDQTLGLDPLGGGGSLLGALLMVRPWCIDRSYCSRGGSSISLNSLSFRQEESHACRHVGSLSSSLLRLNWTCFLGLSSTGVGALPCCALLLDFQVLACSFRSLI